MTDLAPMHAAFLAKLRDIPNLAVYDGDVPAAPPADNQGYLLGYLLVFSAAQPAAMPMSYAASKTLLWTGRVQAVGGTQARCLQVASLARAQLAGTRVDGALLIENDLGPENVLIDRDVTPARFYLPLSFTALTTF